MVIPRCVRTSFVAALSVIALAPRSVAEQAGTTTQDGSVTTLRTSVRRVIVDVVVTDHDGKTVPGLTREDFSVFEDNHPQRVLSFDPSGFSDAMDYSPPRLPVQPPNTFVNLPASPEKGPLYVLLYDLVNTEKNEDQVFARAQLAKFIKSKPEGTQFAIFVLSDGLHLVQGFTSDRRLLYAAIDPNSLRPHVPKIFLMGKNFGQNDPGTAVLALKYLANYLDGLPGRKNVIWLAGNFPVTLFPSDDESTDYIAESKKTLDLLARGQIALYPVDVRGVSIENPHAPAGSTGGGGLSSDAREPSAAASNTPSAGSARAAASISPGAGGLGYNTLSASYMTADEIARVTGGRAFYSTNDVASALERATEDGASYYTLSYAPTDREYDEKLHSIRVELAKKGYSLAYRRAYYSLDPNIVTTGIAKSTQSPGAQQPARRKAEDSLQANMRHGAPMAHALIFGAHVQAIGEPNLATPEQMALLADEQAFFRARQRGATPKPRTPIKLQKYAIRYTVMTHQLQSSGGGGTPSLELAAAAYDADGATLNAIVNVATRADASATAQQPSYRMVQELMAPAHTATIRVAVRDTNTDRVGAMEINLPLTPEAQAVEKTRSEGIDHP